MDCLSSLKSAFGFYSKEQIEEATEDENFRTFMKASNIMNGVSAILSPIVGIIRLIAAAILLCKENGKKSPNEDTVAAYKAHMIRGAAEILGLGLILEAIDIVRTLQINKLCCFKEASEF